MNLSKKWNTLVQGTLGLLKPSPESNLSALENDREKIYDHLIAAHYALDNAHKNELRRVLNDNPSPDDAKPYHSTEQERDRFAKEYATICKDFVLPNEYSRFKIDEIKERGAISMKDPKSYIQRNPELSEPRLRELYEENPADIGVAQWFAISLQLQGKYEEALEVNRLTLLDNPKNPTCFSRYSITLEEAEMSGEYELVDKEYQRFIESGINVPDLEAFFEEILEQDNMPDPATHDL